MTTMTKREARKSQRAQSTDEERRSAAAKHLDEKLDEALKGTFPASDPIAIMQTPEQD